jgi:hypothetical protein
MRRTYYIYKGFDREDAVSIIAPNVGKERMVSEVKRLHALHGHITIRNCLGGLVSEMRDGKIYSFMEGAAQ